MRISDWSSDVCSSDLPVAAIRNYAAGCLRTLDGPGGLEQSRWALQQIEGEAERATRIMRSVYNFTKHKRVERKVLPVVDIIADIFAFLQLKVQETEATLVLDVKKRLTAWCDKTDRKSGGEKGG